MLITICLLLGLIALGCAQSGKRQLYPRDVTVAPATSTASPSERRVALVIGNDQYRHVPRLANPTNDARLIAETLMSVGFTLIGSKAQLDLDKAAFDRVVQEFGTMIQGAGVALFYYAGHGLQVRGTNYLVPVSANPTREADVDFQLFNVDLVLRQMEGAGTRLNFLILDACRNNPFAGRGLRAAVGGLAQMQAPEGTLIAYATQPGNVALDGTDGHSPYTSALASAVRKPGLDVFAVFNETGLDVKQRTGGAQQPWVSSSPIAGQFYFTGAPDQQPTGGNGDAVEIAFWNSVKDAKTPDAVQAYLQQYPKGKFASLATLKLKELTEPPTPAPSPPVPETPSRPTPPSSSGGTQVAVGVYPQPPEASKTLRNRIGMEFILIPAGEFQMGSNDKDASDDEEPAHGDEKPVHTVRITQPFYLGKYEVTQDQWQAVMGNNPSYFKGKANRPVDSVSWEDVQEFIRRLNSQEGGATYRLPTEAEWEYAARAGTTTRWSFGDDASHLGRYAWYNENADGETHPVGQLQPNPWGLYDMHGNVWEWVQDWYGEYASGTAVDPMGPSSGPNRVNRGGSFYYPARDCRSAGRGSFAHGTRYAYFGFRLLMVAQ
jgi:formylglycine-generating enzyme required for sulfatase activity